MTTAYKTETNIFLDRRTLYSRYNVSGVIRAVVKYSPAIEGPSVDPPALRIEKVPTARAIRRAVATNLSSLFHRRSIRDRLTRRPVPRSTRKIFPQFINANSQAYTERGPRGAGHTAIHHGHE